MPALAAATTDGPLAAALKAAGESLKAVMRSRGGAGVLNPTVDPSEVWREPSEPKARNR